VATDWSALGGVEAWIVSIDLVGFSRLALLEDQTAWRTALTLAARRGLLNREDPELAFATFLGDEIRVAFDAGKVDGDDALGWAKGVLRKLAENQRTPKPEARAFVLGPGKVFGETLDEPRCRYLDGPLVTRLDAWTQVKPKLGAWTLASSSDPGPGSQSRRFGQDAGWVLSWPPGRNA